ncbi:MAG: hypothetical protein ACKOEO_04420, partial [Planctomycetaceae bacterium]
MLSVFASGFAVVDGEFLAIGRGREVANDGIERFLNAFVLVGGAHEHRGDLLSDVGFANDIPDLLDGDCGFFEECLHEGVVVQGEFFEHVTAGVVGGFAIFFRDRLANDVFALVT